MKENASEWEMIYSPEACETFTRSSLCIFTVKEIIEVQKLIKKWDSIDSINQDK